MYCTNKAKRDAAIKKLNNVLDREDLIIDIFNEMFDTEEIDWIDQWVALWPDGIKSGGAPVKSAADVCLTKMKAFIKRTGATKEDIFEATENYLEEKAMSGWGFTKRATYFIDKKGEGSMLEDLIKQLDEDEIYGGGSSTDYNETYNGDFL